MNNYARFYAAFNELPCEGDREEMKCNFVCQFTNGRSESLKDMTPAEYHACCYALEKMSGRAEKVKKMRSVCLKLMQELGVKTSDWARVDNFCMNARIAGKAFRYINLTELERLSVKLRAIIRNGGLHKQESGCKVVALHN